ncbi:Pentatricopeptide repeat [Dillenia turbinata]|uniref:Pentatricopeptide repeat n=1 Tax=Dillenia turbinata TaxID=194707 RepID=A0AAN8V1E4_9MAGN
MVTSFLCIQIGSLSYLGSEFEVTLELDKDWGHAHHKCADWEDMKKASKCNPHIQHVNLAFVIGLSEQEVVLFTTLFQENQHKLTLFCSLGKFQLALLPCIEFLLIEMHPGKVIHCQAIKHGFDSDSYVMTCLLDVYAKGGDLDSACKVFGKMPERNLVCLTVMITSLVKSGKIDEARHLFDELVERDVVCWNVMIDGYIQHGRPNEGLVLFNEMLCKNVKPSEITVLSVLSACGQVDALESGKWVHSYMENNGFEFNVRIGTALIDIPYGLNAVINAVYTGKVDYFHLVPNSGAALLHLPCQPVVDVVADE